MICRCGTEMVTVRRWTISKMNPPVVTALEGFLGCPQGCDQYAYVSGENLEAVKAILGVE